MSIIKLSNINKIVEENQIFNIYDCITTKLDEFNSFVITVHLKPKYSIYKCVTKKFIEEKVIFPLINLLNKDDLVKSREDSMKKFKMVIPSYTIEIMCCNEKIFSLYSSEIYEDDSFEFIYDFPEEFIDVKLGDD